MELQFRAATEEDRPELLTLVESFYEHEAIPFNRVVTDTALKQLLAEPSLGRLWLLDTEEGIAGYMLIALSFILEFGGRQAFIDELFIRPAFQGRGFGKLALRFIENFCRTEKIRVLRLEVTQSNSRAIRLYSGAGFVLHDRQTMTRCLP